jgi:hypothetical protein
VWGKCAVIAHECINVHSFLKKHIDRIKRPPTEWEKIFGNFISFFLVVLGFELRPSHLLGRRGNHVSETGLIVRIYKEFLQFNN